MKAPRYKCGICNKERRAEQMIYSRHTKTRYCTSHILKPAKKGR